MVLGQKGYCMSKKSIIMMLVLLVMASSVMAEEKVGIRSIRFDEVARAGTELPFFVSVADIYHRNLDDVHVTIDSPDIDIYMDSQAIDIRAGRAGSFIIPVDIPWYIPAGDYMIRFTIRYGDDEQRSYYRELLIR